jgi:hypothetical protein
LFPVEASNATLRGPLEIFPLRVVLRLENQGQEAAVGRRAGAGETIFHLRFAISQDFSIVICKTKSSNDKWWIQLEVQHV